MHRKGVGGKALDEWVGKQAAGGSLDILYTI
jgi:hypothetical protein